MNEPDREGRKETWSARHPLAGTFAVSVLSALVVAFVGIAGSVYLSTYLHEERIATIKSDAAEVKMRVASLESKHHDTSLALTKLDGRMESIDTTLKEFKNDVKAFLNRQNPNLTHIYEKPDH